MRLVSFSFVLLLAAACLAVPPASRPTTAVDPAGCVTDACHARIKAFTVSHGPVSSNACNACHEPVSASEHTFRAPREKTALCTYCHEFSVKGLAVVHKPVADGMCLGCHDPHGGDTHALIREASVAELCARCHGPTMKDKKVLHSPVAQGACDSCHPPHAAKFPKLLDVVGPDLCLTCHREQESMLTAAPVKHKALQQGCEKCHDVHGSSQPMSLLQPSTDLCMSCHTALKEKIQGAAVTHSPVTNARGCINCHVPHAGEVGKLMVAAPSVTCLKCHDKPIKDRERTIGSVADIATLSLHKHGELKDTQCGGCHTVHGGPNENLLQKAYSIGFYEKFSPENAALCLGCHDPKLATEANTTVTGFRNGTANLHLVHVSRGERDKNCRACHTTHTADNDRLIRDVLPYGAWDMKMRFARTPTGGSCFPGCHHEMAYDRVKPVPPTTQPATRPVEVIARAQYENDQMVSWTSIDIAGQPVKVPDAIQPSVLLFVQDDPAAIKSLSAAVPPDPQVDVVVVTRGQARADELKQAMPAGWSLVLDPTNDSASALGVRAWPLVLVLRPDGKVVARLSASSDVLSMKLPPYLDVAAGRVATTRPQPTTQPLVDVRVRQLEHDLREVWQLLNDDKPQAALELIQQLDPASAAAPAVQLARGEALLRLGHPKETIKILESIRVKREPTESEILLHTRAWIALNEWRNAEMMIVNNRDRLIESAAAHQLLGDVYEHGEAWKLAAEEYHQANQIRQRHK